MRKDVTAPRRPGRRPPVSDVLPSAKGVAYPGGMRVTITESDVGSLQIQGPKSKEVMTEVFGADILGLPYCHPVERGLEGMRMVISRTGSLRKLGYKLYLGAGPTDCGGRPGLTRC
jgi:glycine cleavage system aminomethyltransferase T